MKDSIRGSLGSLSEPTQTKYPTFTEERRFDRRERLTSQSLKYKNREGEQTSTYSRTYDKRGQITSVTDANGKTSAYEYDALRQLVQYTDNLGNTTKADYDARGNLIKLTDAKGNAY